MFSWHEKVQINNCHGLQTVNSNISYHHILSHISVFCCTDQKKIKYGKLKLWLEINWTFFVCLFFIRKCPFAKTNQNSYSCMRVWLLSDRVWLTGEVPKCQVWQSGSSSLSAKSPLQASWFIQQPGGLVPSMIAQHRSCRSPKFEAFKSWVL